MPRKTLTDEEKAENKRKRLMKKSHVSPKKDAERVEAVEETVSTPITTHVRKASPAKAPAPTKRDRPASDAAALPATKRGLWKLPRPLRPLRPVGPLRPI